MNYLLAFLAGVSAKIYDDLRDNKILINFKNRDILEILKLFHMGAFVKVSFDCPLYIYIIGIVVLFNIIGDTNCYKFVYEKCLFIALLLFVPFFDNSKIKIPSLTIFSFVLSPIILFITCTGAYIEANIVKEEYSYRKLFLRIIGVLWGIFIYYYFLNVYEPISLIQMYVIGYCMFSIIVQIYCLFIYVPNKNQKIQKSKNRKSKNKKIKTATNN